MSIPKDIRQETILDKDDISTREIITYLESVNTSNASILGVLRRKPALPGVEQLEWVINSKIDLKITNKLKNSLSLNFSERLRLKATLGDVLISLKKQAKPRGSLTKADALKEYIDTL